MSNHGNSANILTARIDKNGINEKSLMSILEMDNDFTENEGYFREDTLKKGFENEAERVSTEIFKKHKKVKEECERVEKMVSDLFNVPNFIGTSGSYGSYDYDIIETEFEYIISIAYVN